VDGVFYSSLICERDEIEEIIDARTSDAISMALRFNAPIFVYDSILKQAGFSSEDISKNDENKSEDNWIKSFVEEQSKQKELPDDLIKLSLSKLKTLLNKLVNLEDYEKAVKIRDEISKRETNK
jgi:bifunctional DNase/RNase